MPHHPSGPPAGAPRVPLHAQGARTVPIPPVRWATVASPVPPPAVRAVQPKSPTMTPLPVRFPQASRTGPPHVPSAAIPGHPGNARQPHPAVQRQASFRPGHRVTGAAPGAQGRVPVLSTARVTPHGVIQRMEEEKSPWRHLDTAPTNSQWQHSGKPKPLLQIAIGRHVVYLLRVNNIQARLGGSVAALGYCTTRNPDDIDIDILPKNSHAHVNDIAKDELEPARQLVSTRLIGECFQCQTGEFNWGYEVHSITTKSASTHVIELQIDGKLIRNRHNPYSYKIHIHEEMCSFKLQIINETAFTFMNLSKDPGTVEKEKYKEVTGFARLVANCLGRLIQDSQSHGSDSKNDRQRIKEMLGAKMASAPAEKFASLCGKIIYYFNDDNKRSAARLLGDIVHELNQSIQALQFAQEMLKPFGIMAVDPLEIQTLFQSLMQSGVLGNLNPTGGPPKFQ